MAFLHNDLLDGLLDDIKNTGDVLSLCDTEPTDATEAETTYMLAKVTGLTSGDYTGPADGDTSGRKLTKDAESGISVTNSGDTAYFAIVDSGTKLLVVGTCTAQTLTAGNTVNTTAVDIELRDAADE